MRLAVGEHGSPVSGGRLRAQAEERQVGDVEDGVGDLEGRVDDDGADRVAHDVRANGSGHRSAHTAHRDDVLARAQGEGLASNQSGCAQPGQRRHDDDEDRDGRGDHRGDQHEEEQDGHGHECVNDTHHDRIDPAAHEARDRTVEGADRCREDACEEADDNRGLATLHEAPELVVTDHIGAERVLRGGGQRRVRQVGVDLVGHIEHGADEREGHQDEDQAHAEDGEFVFHEDLQALKLRRLPGGARLRWRAHGCGCCGHLARPASRMRGSARA